VNGELIEQARSCIEHGWSLLPVQPGAKAPNHDLLHFVYHDTRTAHLRYAPALLAEVELWFENEPEGNLAVIPGSPSRLLIVDVDRLDLLDPDIATPTALSGREGGGKHFYFECEPNLAMKRMPWGHINPAYVVLPGSIHPAGRPYTWLPGRSPDEVPLMPFETFAEAFGVEEML